MRDYSKIAEMFDAMEQLSPIEAKPPTMLSVAGVSEKESAASRILAFFLDSSEAHGIGTLWMDSLLECAGGWAERAAWVLHGEVGQKYLA